MFPINSYFATIILITLTMITLMVLLHESGSISHNKKTQFYVAYIAIIVASIAEWLAVYLNGAPANTVLLHLIAKGLDFTVTPAISILLCRPIVKSNKLTIVGMGLITVNMALEILSAFTGWVYYIDENNFYHHGPLYSVYLSICAVLFVLTVISLLLFGKQFKARGKLPLFLIAVTFATGVAMQELISIDIRSCVLGFAMAAVLLLLQYEFFCIQRYSDSIEKQQFILDTDPLTGLNSRYAYEQALTDISNMSEVPVNFTIISMDVNGLKKTNDLFGHGAGDKLLRTAAACMRAVLPESGQIYRVGGDEFIFLGALDKDTPEELKKRLQKECSFRSDDHLSISFGYARAEEYPECNLSALINTADQFMYSDKQFFYSTKKSAAR